MQKPFFLGRAKPGYPQISPDWSQQRFNGSLGCFDPFEAPQYDTDRDWLPFVHRPSSIRASEPCSMAWQPVCVEWSKGRTDGDRMNEQFVERMRRWGAELEIRAQSLHLSNEIDEEDWAHYPCNPCEQDYRALLACRIYEVAVDLTADMQRQLQECDAWIAMICAMGGVSITNSASVWVARYPPANDDLMGMWINDAMEDKVAWLLSVGIPVFIVHRYGPGELH
jgi:hypothetical protein